MRQPTTEERRAERAVLGPIVADLGTNTLLLLTGLLAGSLTLLSEGIRSFFMLMASVYAFVVLRAIHRGRMARFEFGVDKIERFATLVVGLGLVISGILVVRGAVSAVFEPSGAGPSPLWLVLAAIVNAINTAVNVAGWWAMRRVARGEGSHVFKTQLAARFTMMSSSLFLQVTLTVAALSRDVVVALALDALGALFVGVLMIVRGAGMLSAAITHILDRQADAGLCQRIAEAAAVAFPGARIGHVRTRPCAGGVEAELRVGLPAGIPPVEVARGRSVILAQLGAGGGREADISLAVVPEPVH